MRVEELMSEAECCHPGDAIQDAAKLMRDENVGFVPICDQDERPLGALTDRDIVIRCVAESRSFEDDCATIMTKDVIACRIGDDVSDVQQKMRDHQTSRVMVCDQEGKLRGVVSLQDIAESESERETGQTLQDVKSDQPPAVH